MRRKIRTGIEGLDSMLLGGIPELNQVVLAGGPGTGKTLMGFEFLYKGVKMGEPGVMIALEETPEMIIENAKAAFTDYTDIDDMVSDKKLAICDTMDLRTHLSSRDSPREAFGKLTPQLESIIEDTKATRVFFDSLSILKLLINDPQEYRNLSVDLVTNFRRLNLTSIFTVEIDVAEKERMMFQPEFFFYDGIITMYSSGDGGANRSLTLEIIKMRGTKHSRATVPYEITQKGMDMLSLAKRGGGI